MGLTSVLKSQTWPDRNWNVYWKFRSILETFQNRSKGSDALLHTPGANSTQTTDRTQKTTVQTRSRNSQSKQARYTSTRKVSLIMIWIEYWILTLRFPGLQKMAGFASPSSVYIKFILVASQCKKYIPTLKTWERQGLFIELIFIIQTLLRLLHTVVSVDSQHYIR